MSKLFEYELPLSDNQIHKLQNAINNKKSITLQISKKDINTNNNLKKILLTKTQINKIEKHKRKNKGVEINLSLSQLRKNQKGGLLPLLPILAKVASIAGPLLLSGVSGLINGASDAIGKKLAGNGVSQNIEDVNLNIPKKDLQEIINYISILENKSILPGGSKVAVDRSIEQNGGAFILPLLATLLGSFLPTLFSSKGKGIYLPWETKN